MGAPESSCRRTSMAGGRDGGRIATIDAAEPIGSRVSQRIKSATTKTRAKGRVEEVVARLGGAPRSLTRWTQQLDVEHCGFGGITFRRS